MLIVCLIIDKMTTDSCVYRMNSDYLIGVLMEHFRDAQVSVTDISDNGRYYKISIKSSVFNGKNSLDKQRYFYSLVWDKIKCYLSGVTLNLVGSYGSGVEHEQRKRIRE